MTKEEKEAIEDIKRILENANPFTMPLHIYNSLTTVLNIIQNLQKDNEKKDKVIDLMAGHITDGSVMKRYKEICKNVSGEMDCIYTPIDKVNCVGCIKQWFEKKAKCD